MGIFVDRPISLHPLGNAFSDIIDTIIDGQNYTRLEWLRYR
jgi:hypothetical protein